MPASPLPPSDPLLSRRQVLGGAGSGFATMALAAMLDAQGLLAPRAQAADGFIDPLAPRAPHFTPKAKHCIFLFMFGGPSQMDLFDYKPELQQRDGMVISSERRRNEVSDAQLLASRRSFRRWGETGQWCSDALPSLGPHMDKLAVIKSLYTDSFAHGSAVLQMNGGQPFTGHPALGSWATYGLGNENENLPAFVVMHDPRGGPISGASNWSSGYMPAAYQGTLFRASGDPLLYLSPEPTRSGRAGTTAEMQRRQIDALQRFNQAHAADRVGHDELAARIAAYELAFQMQVSAPEALDLSTEDEATRAMYCVDEAPGEHRLSVGPAPFGQQCLIARRLIERGTRFVQIYHGGGHQQQTWDAHYGVEENLSIHGPEVDRPIAALLTDLERRGLLDETLVIWGGEFGRMPVSQLKGEFQEESVGGRDHNPKGFTMWMAGAGVKPGSYGETDEIGGEAVVNRHHIRDFHATVLHLMGLDHLRLSYLYGGLDRRLTGPQEAHVIRGVLA